MAKKEEEKKEKPVKDSTEPKVVSRKRKLVLILGLTLILVLGGGVGGFFAYQTFFASKTPTQEALGDKKEEDKKEEGHETASTKSEAHGASSENTPKAGDVSSASTAASLGTETSLGQESPDKKIETGPREFGSTFFIPIMNINLGNPLENRFLRIEVSLEYVGGDTQKAELEKRLPQYKDILISSISKRERFDLLSHEGRENLRRELLNRFNEVSQKPIAAVYFTEFLVE